jgi:DNA-binding NtrC family response regulator
MTTTVSAPEIKAVQNQRTALVVDDIEEMLDLLEIAVGGAGFSVMRASSAAEALDTFNAHREDIDLVMMDVRLGAEDGLELAHALLLTKPSLRVLAISGFEPDRRLIKAKRSMDFLAKPFTTSELKKKLEAMFTSPAESSAASTCASCARG